MSKAPNVRLLLTACAAALLLGLLAFLFAKTEATGYKADLQALSLLRELRDMDARWDADGQALFADLSRAPTGGSERSLIIARILQELGRPPAREASANPAQALRPLIADKEAAYRALQNAHALSVSAVGRGKAFEAARARESEVLARFSRFTIGARVDQAAHDLSIAIEAALDEKDRWRVYLLAYAAALLVGVGYLTLRVARAQAALREANQTLERRVEERTRDLQATLRRLQESESQLVQTEKMSSLGQLVAGVAHEINTPLAYVKNSVATVRDHMDDLSSTVQESLHLVSLLESREPDAASLQAAHDALAARVHRLQGHDVLADLDTLTRDGLHGIEQIAELVANLRNFSRLDRSRVASFNVNEGVRATLLIAKPALRKVDVEKRLGEIPSITCSPSQVNQVLLNLVTNAVQAIDKPRGRIIVCTRREGAEAIAIEVSDNGRGIAPEIMGRIFDPFFTTKETGKGTGLGLSIAYKIVAQHGGRIEVRSEVGVGSTFTVHLPLRAPAEPAPQPIVEEAA